MTEDRVPRLLICEGCGEPTLRYLDDTCPECGFDNESDHMRVGWDNKQ